MLRCINEMKGYTINGTDGQIGKVTNFFFDDRYWMIRYLIVDVGHWLQHKEVLISPEVLQKPGIYSLSVNLTKEQIEKSPVVDTQKTVSRQEEEKLRKHYDWPMYWFADPMFGSHPPIPSREVSEYMSDEESVEKRNRKISHLRSTKEVTGYHIEATDGEIGHVGEFIVDTESWKIRYIVVSTHDVMHGKNVLLAPDWLKSIIWKDKKITVNSTMEAVRNGPEFTPTDPVNKEYEEVVYDYYGHRKYW